jgi:hypothetical protein
VVAADGEVLDAVPDVQVDALGDASVAVPRKVLLPGARLLVFRLGERGSEEPILDLPIRIERN